MNKNNTFISVIIPTCNRNETLKNCLDHLRPEVQNAEENSYEVIVSDDSENDMSQRLIKDMFTWVRWLKGPQKGPAANRNNGAKDAIGKWLIFIDDDVVPTSNLVSKYASGIKQSTDSLAFEGSIFPDDARLLQKDMSECPVNTEGGCFWSANICVNTELFKDIGGFNEMYSMAAQEDQQMKIDIEKKGFKIVFLKECIVIHPVRFTSMKSQIKRISTVSKNFSLFAFKNRNVLGYTSILRFFVSQYLFHCRSFLSLLRQRKLKSSIISCVYFFYGLPLNVLNFYKFSKLSNGD